MSNLSALDLLAEAAVLVDEDGIVRHVNDRAGPLLDMGAHAIGEPLTAHLDVRDATGRSVTLGQHRQSVGQRLPEQVVHVEVLGRPRPVAVTGRWGGRGLLLTFRHAGRRERLGAVHGDVVATVSHEIRSPLTSVKGFTRTLLDRWDRFSDEQKRTMLATIDEDADRVTRLLGELLDVSRIDADRVQLHRRPVDVVAVARTVVDKARHRDVGRGRDLEVEAVGRRHTVHADPDKLEQVLINLVENALRYAPDGSVRVEVTVPPGDDATMVEVAVRDEGPGIPVEQHGLVFQKFGRATGNRRTGTGLGLYISRGLVEAHGGTIRIDPDATPGTTLRVRLPISS